MLDTNTALTNVLAETDTEGNVQAYNLYGLGLIARFRSDETVSYYHYDSRGSTVALTDQAESIIGSYAFSPFGMLLADSGVTDNPFRYLGKHGVLDERHGLSYVRARYYDAGQQRFLSKDPYLGESRRSQTLNRYAYATNNPIRMVDVSGYSASEVVSGKPETASGPSNAPPFVDDLLTDGFSPQLLAASLEQSSTAKNSRRTAKKATNKVVPIAPGSYVVWEYCLGFFLGTCETRIVGRDNDGNGYFTSTGSAAVIAGFASGGFGGGLRRSDPVEGSVYEIKADLEFESGGKIELSAELGKPGFSGLSVEGGVGGLTVSDDGKIQGKIGAGVTLKLFSNSQTNVISDEEIFYDFVTKDLGVIF